MGRTNYINTVDVYKDMPSKSCFLKIDLDYTTCCITYYAVHKITLDWYLMYNVDYYPNAPIYTNEWKFLSISSFYF